MAFVSLFIKHHKYLHVSSKLFNAFYVNQLPRIQCFHNEINEKVEARLKRKDDVGNDFRIVYRAPYEIYCKVAYSVAIFSSTLLPPFLASIVYYNGLGVYPAVLGSLEIIKSTSDLAVFAAGLTFAVIQCSLVVSKYPYRIYRHTSDNTYILIYQHKLPWKNYKEFIQAGELYQLDAIFTWNDSLYKFRDKKAIIFDHNFQKPIDFEEMLTGPKKPEGT